MQLRIETRESRIRRATFAAAFLILNSSFLMPTAAAEQASATTAELKQKFERRLQEIAARVDGVVGYELLDLTSGERIAHLEGETFPTASTIKLTLVYELFKQVEEKKIRLEEPITLDRAKAVGGTGILFELGTPTLSVSDYATLMVTLSDNTATNVLIDRLGMDNVARRMQALGLSGTKLRRHMMDTAAARRGDENVSTPDELARLLAAMNGAHGGLDEGAFAMPPATRTREDACGDCAAEKAEGKSPPKRPSGGRRRRGQIGRARRRPRGRRDCLRRQAPLRVLRDDHLFAR